MARARPYEVTLFDHRDPGTETVKHVAILSKASGHAGAAVQTIDAYTDSRGEDRQTWRLHAFSKYLPRRGVTFTATSASGQRLHIFVRHYMPGEERMRALQSLAAVATPQGQEGGA